MFTVALRNNKIDYFINKLDSNNFGFFISFILHFVILIFAIGVPNFFDKPPITIPNVIPIEIINVTDVTSIPKKIQENEKEKISKKITETKKFNSSETKEIERIEIKEKSKIKEKEIIKAKINKDDVLIENKVNKNLQLEKEKKIIPKEKIEVLPTKKIKPKIKPKPTEEISNLEKKSDMSLKVQPKPKPKQDFNISSMLKDLRNEKNIQNNAEKEKEEKKEKENISDEKEEISKKNIQLSISEIDLLRQQLSSCWIAPAGAVIERGMFVKIYAKIQQNKKVYNDSVRIVDTNISKSNPFYGPITRSAMNTLLNPDCIPLKLPEKKYSLWKNLTINFDYSIMKGY